MEPATTLLSATSCLGSPMRKTNIPADGHFRRRHLALNSGDEESSSPRRLDYPGRSPAGRWKDARLMPAVAPEKQGLRDPEGSHIMESNGREGNTFDFSSLRSSLASCLGYNRRYPARQSSPEASPPLLCHSGTASPASCSTPVPGTPDGFDYNPSYVIQEEKFLKSLVSGKASGHICPQDLDLDVEDDVTIYFQHGGGAQSKQADEESKYKDGARPFVSPLDQIKNEEEVRSKRGSADLSRLRQHIRRHHRLLDERAVNHAKGSSSVKSRDSSITPSRKRGAEQPSGGNGQEGQQSKRTRNGRGGRAGEDDGTDSSEDGEQTEHDDGGKSKSKEENTRSFACPFYKRDPFQQMECMNYKLMRIRDVKQHLQRRHSGPPLYCPVCYKWFPSVARRDSHIRSRECEPQPPPAPGSFEGVSTVAQEQLKHRVSRTASQVDQWYAVWDILFPGIEKPSNPYLGTVLEETFGMIRDFWNSQGPLIVRDMLPAVNGVVQTTEVMQGLMVKLFDEVQDRLSRSVRDGIAPKGLNSTSRSYSSPRFTFTANESSDNSSASPGESGITTFSIPYGLDLGSGAIPSTIMPNYHGPTFVDRFTMPPQPATAEFIYGQPPIDANAYVSSIMPESFALAETCTDFGLGANQSWECPDGDAFFLDRHEA